MDELTRLRDELAAERAKRAEAEAQLQNSTLVLQEICDEWNEECQPECDSFGHVEKCKATDIAQAKRALRLRAESAEARLKEAVVNSERYRFLQTAPEWHVIHVCGPDGESTEYGPALDAEIDRAIATQEAG